MKAKKPTYASVRTNMQHKMNYYKTLCNQTTGAVSKCRPTPAQLYTFCKWIDKGAIIHNVTNVQLNRWAGKPKTWTVGSAKTALYHKWGKNYIKAVVWNKSGGFIVATSPTRKGQTFKFTS